MYNWNTSAYAAEWQLVLYIFLSLFRFLLILHDKSTTWFIIIIRSSLSQSPAHRVNHYLGTVTLYWLTSEINPVYINPRGQTFPPLSAHTEVSYHHPPLSSSVMSLGRYDRPRSFRNCLVRMFVMANKNFPSGWHFMLIVCHMKNKLPPVVTSV